MSANKLTIAKLRTRCRSTESTLFGHTVDDVREIADELDIPYKCNLNKNDLCLHVSGQVNIQQLAHVFEKKVGQCRTVVKHYQTSRFIATLTPAKAVEFLPIVTEQLLWLFDRVEEYHQIMNGDKTVKRKVSDLIMLISTLDGQCRQADTIFKQVSRQPARKTASKGRWSWW